MAFTPVTITGTFEDPDTTHPLSVTGTATLSHRLVNGTQIAEPDPVSFQTNASGQVVNMSEQPLVLLAVDDTGTQPKGAVYRFAITVDAAPLDPFEAVVSASAPGGTVDLSALIPSLP